MQRVLADKRETERRASLLTDALRETRESLRGERLARRAAEEEGARAKGALEARCAALEARAAHAVQVLREAEAVMEDRKRELMTALEEAKATERRESAERQRLG